MFNRGVADDMLENIHVASPREANGTCSWIIRNVFNVVALFEGGLICFLLPSTLNTD